MVKSVTRDEDAGRQTTIVGIACQFPGTASISVARETGDGQRGNWTVLLKSESGVVWESHRSQLDLGNMRPRFGRTIWATKTIGIEPLLEPSVGRGLVLEERFSKADGKSWTRKAHLSSHQLGEMAADMLKRCGNMLPERDVRVSAPR